MFLKLSLRASEKFIKMNKQNKLKQNHNDYK
jgi:hypothetical protein